MNSFERAVLCLFACLAVACGGTTEDVTARSANAILSEPAPDGNSFACLSCHALEEPAADGIRRPGHQLGDAFNRASYKNGRVTDLLDAVNSCRTEWMLASAWQSDDAEWRTLSAELAAIAPAGEAAPIAIQVVAPPTDVSGGDAIRGQALFNSSCNGCHGIDGGGSIRAPGITGLGLEAEYIARRVRTSGLANSEVYDGLTGGRMPFWGADRLSDDELRDLAEYISTADAPDPVEPDPNMEMMGRTCASTHARVGQTAELRTFFHGVKGTATILDDCNIELSNFVFDGAGIDVRIYGATGGNYRSGFAVSGDLVKRGGYQGDTIRLTLPEDRTLDQLDGISVWCVAVGVDFGSGDFR